MTVPALPVFSILSNETEATLDEILSILDAVDAGDLTLTEEATDNLKRKLLLKTDACRFRLKEFEDEANRLRGYAREFTEAARAVENKAARLEAYIAYAMKRNGFEKIPGEKFTLSLRRSEAVEISEEFKATEELYGKYREFMRAKYEWSASAIKDAIKSGSHAFTFATIKENFTPIFSVKKGK